MLPRRVATNPPQAKRKTRIICGPNAGNRFPLKPEALSNSTKRAACPVAAVLKNQVRGRLEAAQDGHIVQAADESAVSTLQKFYPEAAYGERKEAKARDCDEYAG